MSVVTSMNLSRLNGYLIDFGSNGISGSVFVYLTRQISPDRLSRPTDPPGCRR